MLVETGIQKLIPMVSSNFLRQVDLTNVGEKLRYYKLVNELVNIFDNSILPNISELLRVFENDGVSEVKLCDQMPQRLEKVKFKILVNF